MIIYNNARSDRQCEFTFKRSRSNREKFNFDFKKDRIPVFNHGKRIIIMLLSSDITHTPKSLLLFQMRNLIANMSYTHIYILAIDEERCVIERKLILDKL
jgi:hypothetical protein